MLGERQATTAATRRGVNLLSVLTLAPAILKLHGKLDQLNNSSEN